MPPCCLIAALAVSEPAPAELPAPLEPAAEESRHHRDAPVLAVSSGAALVGSGLLFSVAGRNSGDFDDARTDHQLEAAAQRTNTWVAAGTGALVLAGGLGVAAVVRW